MADKKSVLEKRLKRAVARARAAETIAEDASRDLYLGQQRLEEALARETRLKTELETLLQAMEAFLHSELKLPEIAQELCRFIDGVIACDGLELSIEGVDDIFIGGSAEDADDRHSMRIPMPVDGYGDATVTLFNKRGWDDDLDARVPEIMIGGAAGAVRNALAMDKVRQRTLTDPLTGLRNRRGLTLAGHSALNAARRTGRPLSVIMADIDLFKNVNDAFGHPAGDAALSAVAVAMADRTRPVDTVARVGGEEFAIILPDTEPTDACLLAERIRAAVRELPLDGNGVPFSVTISLGVASLRGPIDDLDQLLARADLALYVAKENGRDRWVCAPDDE